MNITIVKDRKTSLDVSINWKKSVEEYDLFPTIISIVHNLVHNYLPRIHFSPLFFFVVVVVIFFIFFL